MNFIFLRHAHYQQPEGVPSALLPHPLTPEGIQQAKKGAQKLISFFKGKEKQLPQYIETSSLLRTYQTAEIISEALNMEFSIDLKIVETDQLAERKMGPMANLTVKEIEAVLEKDPRYSAPPPNWKSSKNYRLPFIDCESLAMAGQRVANYIKTTPSNHIQNTNAFRILVGHGASFRYACAALDILQETQIPSLSMHYAEPLFFQQEKQVWKHIGGNWKQRNLKDNID